MARIVSTTENTSAIPAIVDSIYNNLENRNITLNNVMYILKEIMLYVEEYKGLVGHEKKRVCLDVLHRVIENRSDFYRNTLNLVLNYIIPDAVDIICTASKNRLLLNNVDSDKGCFCI